MLFYEFSDFSPRIMSGRGGLNRPMFFLAMSSYAVFLIIVSILLDKAPSAALVCSAGFVFLLSLVIGRKYPRVQQAQILFVAFFHWTSHLNWAYPLYMLLMSRQLLQTQRLTRSIALVLVYAGVFTTVLISYSAHTLYDYLLIASDIWVFAILLIVIRYIVRIHVEQQTLRQENQHLSLRDPLTGLFTLQEFHRHIDDFIVAGNPFVVSLIDCFDFKSVNYEQGFEHGNAVLKEVSAFLQGALPHVDLLSRYEGDKFALAIQTTDVQDTLTHIERVVHIDLKEQLNVDAIFACITYPTDASSKDVLMSTLESSLFEAKRNAWVQRGERMLHSEKLKVVGEMAAGMAHEIRNPLTTIQGLLQISAKSDYNVGPWYSLIMQEIQRMSALTGEFLQLSKPKSAHFERTSLQQLVQKIVPLVEPSAIQMGHHLTVDEHEDPLMVTIDVAKMSQVVLNIIKNAFEAMEQPGAVNIRVIPQGKNGVIEIRDTGKGMSAAEVRKLFQPFHTTKEHGTGLGLYICHAIVNNHDGTILVTSTPGAGSEFQVILPQAAEEE